MTAIRLLVVDDHTLFRRGLIALLGQDARFSVAGEAADAGEAQRRASELQPDVILLDNHLPGVNGVDALNDLREAAPHARILMLTVSEDERDLGAALRAGARGYLLKTVDAEALADSIVRTMRDESVVSPEMTGKLVQAYRAMANAGEGDASSITDDDPATLKPEAQHGSEPEPALSIREQEILTYIARGASNKEIARALAISETTVKIHVQHILRKLKLTSRVQAAVYATVNAIGRPTAA
ncbi:two-component system nitrate/nitrite response regulator NarL [Burkholderia sp. OAS925]|uniref:response regulator n=1 Tax=Paraburkholderia TaxID=1822464 RepID=UPI0017896E18|nr:response regulator [Paraburkholderia graminis]MDR6475522.1 two-component system nitrate/nitrite response regulator NarL [Paraburkholderia graminis]